MRVTVDTNNLAPSEFDRLADTAEGLTVEFAHVSVSDREMDGFRPRIAAAEILETAVWDESTWGEAVWGGSGTEILEVWVLGESQLGRAVLGDQSDADRLERLLSLVSRGTFPASGSRDDLSNGHRRQLRDAMILAAHIREARDIFVTNDRKGFIGDDGKVRETIESEFGTRVMTADEFIRHCASLRRRSDAGPTCL